MLVNRRIAQRLLLVCVIAASLPVLGGQQPASAELYFKALGRADGMRLVAGAGDALPLGAAVEVGVPTAAVTVSSQSSSGFASAPYPGPVLQGALGLAASQGAPEVAYPAVVESRFPGTPTSETAAGSYSLKATSTETRSSADAKVENGQPGQSVASTTAHAAAATSAGVVSVEAVGRVQSLDVASVLRLGSVESRVEIIRGTDGRLTRTSRLTIEGATVAGQSIAIGPGGVTVGSQAVPLAQTPLDAILAERGVTLSYLPSKKVDGSSILGAGLRIDVVADTPSGRLDTVYTLGRSFASLTSSDDATSTVRPDGPTTGSSSPDLAPAIVVPRPASGLAVSDPPAGSPVTLSPPAVPDRPVVAAPAVTGVGEVALFGDLSGAFGYWYLALVTAACATLVSGGALRVLGVRQPSGVHR